MEVVSHWEAKGYRTRKLRFVERLNGRCVFSQYLQHGRAWEAPIRLYLKPPNFFQILGWNPPSKKKRQRSSHREYHGWRDIASFWNFRRHKCDKLPYLWQDFRLKPPKHLWPQTPKFCQIHWYRSSLAHSPACYRKSCLPDETVGLCDHLHHRLENMGVGLVCIGSWESNSVDDCHCESSCKLRQPGDTAFIRLLVQLFP